MSLDASSCPERAVADTAESRTGIRASLIRRLLPKIDHGSLKIVLPSGTTISLEAPNAGRDATIILHRWRALTRMFLAGENGFSDSYVDGEWSTPDIGALLEFFMQNEDAFARRSEPNRLDRIRDRLQHRFNANTKRGSRKNIAAHYDLGNDFYRLWLDDGMNYSSAVYAADESLEQAQVNKLKRIADLLSLSGGERVLEIGCGWGALAEQLTRQHNARLVGLTLSEEQLQHARDRLRANTSADSPDIRLQDYRDCDGQYDRVVSIEMLEAVGERYWPTYFGKIASSLAKGGVAVLQAITIEDTRFDRYRSRPDFIQRYIFPGGMLPTMDRIESEAKRCGLTLTSIETFGDSYARTLSEWRARFLASWSKIEPLGFDQRFKRMWEYYLAYCEAGFRFGAIDVGLFRLVRE